MTSSSVIAVSPNDKLQTVHWYCNTKKNMILRNCSYYTATGDKKLTYCCVMSDLFYLPCHDGKNTRRGDVFLICLHLSQYNVQNNVASAGKMWQISYNRCVSIVVANMVSIEWQAKVPNCVWLTTSDCFVFFFLSYISNLIAASLQSY